MRTTRDINFTKELYYRPRSWQMLPMEYRSSYLSLHLLSEGQVLSVPYARIFSSSASLKSFDFTEILSAGRTVCSRKLLFFVDVVEVRGFHTPTTGENIECQPRTCFLQPSLGIDRCDEYPEDQPWQISVNCPDPITENRKKNTNYFFLEIFFRQNARGNTKLPFDRIIMRNLTHFILA